MAQPKKAAYTSYVTRTVNPTVESKAVTAMESTLSSSGKVVVAPLRRSFPRVVALFALALVCAAYLIYVSIEHFCPARTRPPPTGTLANGTSTRRTSPRWRDRANKLPSWIEPYGMESERRPQWCAQLERSPRARPYQPLYGECGRPHNGVYCADGRPSFFGWKNEDLYTWNRHFRHLKRIGVFLDVAANEPVSRSNTYFYEQCLGWRGVCVEANPNYYDALRSKRTCALVKRCVSNRRHSVTFVDKDGISGVLSTNKNFCVWADMSRRSRRIECVQTAKALAALGETTIDFMSLDVEGHELFVLQGIDWKVTKINVIVTESQQPELQDYLEKRGFRLHAVERPDEFDALRVDRLFVHQRVTWGSPV